MILVENSSSFVPSPAQSDYATSSHQNQFAAFDSPNQNDPFLDLDEIEQLLSTEPVESANSTASASPGQLCDYFAEENDADDEEFLELDLSDSSSQDQEDELNLNVEALNPSVQRLFCQTSMSNYSSASSAISSLVDVEVGAGRLCESKRPTFSKPSFLKQSSSSYLFGNAFDNASSCGSGSSASSTPSTPSSTIGAFAPLPHSSLASSFALPSFSEIYSPRYKSVQSQFDSGDFFKFEDYISEGDSVSESDESSNALLSQASIPPLVSGAQCLQTAGTTAATGTGQFGLLNPQIILKEEPMDSFIPTTTAALESAMQLKQSTSSSSKYCGSQFFETATKPEVEEHKDELLFRAESPKPMRYHLHSLSLNVMPGAACESMPFEDTFEAMESESIDRITPSVTSFEQASLSAATSMLMAGSSNNLGMPSLMPDSRPLAAESPVESNYGSYRSNKPRTQRTKPAQSQVCAVCGDVATCSHYNQVSCEGCKGFFKRTVQKNAKYTCLGNKDCVVDKRRRNRCQYCRFAKCLSVGMVKEIVRSDHLKGRRGRLPSKPKSPNETPVFPPMSTITALVRAHLDTSADKANLDFSQYNDTIADKAHSESRLREFLDSQLLGLINSSLDTLYAFMEKIPGFNELNELDRKLLFQASCLELFALRMAYRIKPGSNYIILCNNIVLHRNQFAVCFGEWLPMIEELSNQLHAMEIDISALACLCALTVITGRHGVQDINKIDQLETKIINALRDHTIYNNEAQKKPNYFSRILSKLSELRSIGDLGHRVIVERLNKFNLANASPDMRELQKKITPGYGLLPSTNASMGSAESSLQVDLASCLDLPSISSFFKGWPQVK